MRLLKPNEVSFLQQSKLDIEVRQIEELTERLLSVQKKMTLAEDEFQKKKIFISQELNKICSEYKQRETELLNELAVLEERKREAKKPFDSYREQLALKEKELVEREEKNNLFNRSITSQEEKLVEDIKRLEIEKEAIAQRMRVVEEAEKISKETLEQSYQKLSEAQEYQKQVNQDCERQMNELKKQKTENTIILERTRAERIIIDERIRELEKLREEVNIKLARTNYVKN